MAITPFSPNTSFMQGISALKQDDQTLQANQLKLDAAKQQQQDLKDASGYLQDYYKTQNPDSLVNATLKSPQLASQVLQSIGIVDDKQKQAGAADIAMLWQNKDNPEAFRGAMAKRVEGILQRQGNPTDSINLGMLYEQDPAKAQQMLKVAAAGLEAQGYKTGVFADQQDSQTPASIKEIQYYEKLKASNPEAAAMFAKAKGYVDTPKEQNETEAQRNLQQYQKLQSENPELAKQFGQAVGLVSKEGKELSAQAQKRLSDFTDSAIQNGMLEQKYNTLANDLEKADISGGVQTTWSQWAREQTGNQDEVSELRKEYFKVRSSEVVNNLPPGAASDADIAMALKPFPSDKASSKEMASFLRGLAKLKAKERELNDFKASYISEKGTERGMLDAWKESQKQKSSSENVVDWGSLN